MIILLLGGKVIEILDCEFSNAKTRLIVLLIKNTYNQYIFTKTKSVFFFFNSVKTYASGYHGVLKRSFYLLVAKVFSMPLPPPILIIKILNKEQSVGESGE